MDDIIRQESTFIGVRLGAAAGSVIGLFVTDQLSLWWIPLLFVLFYCIGSTAWFLMEKNFQAQREAQRAQQAKLAQQAQRQHPETPHAPIRFNVRGRQEGAITTPVTPDPMPDDDDDEADLVFALDEEGEI